MLRTWKLAVLLVAVAMVWASGSRFAAGLSIGDSAPRWAGIVGVDDKQHGLADYKDAKVVVMVFTCNHCPVAKAYEDRLVELQRDYKKKGVQLVAVNVNNLEADRLEKMKERAEEKEFNFPYLYDPTQEIGRKYGALKTPQIFLLDKDRKLAYTGAIDDSQKEANVKNRHLRDALDAVLAGREPPTAETPAVGCSIKYEK